jgi:hypothetical protein
VGAVVEQGASSPIIGAAADPAVGPSFGTIASDSRANVVILDVVRLRLEVDVEGALTAISCRLLPRHRGRYPRPTKHSADDRSERTDC